MKAPFSCPNNSESMVPSGMAPQLMAIILLCLRGLRLWIILEKDSLPRSALAGDEHGHVGGSYLGGHGEGIVQALGVTNDTVTLLDTLEGGLV